MRPRWERNLATGCAAGGMLLLIAGASVAVVEGGLTRRSSFILVAGVALLIAYAILEPGAVTDLVRSRRARFGSLTVVVTAIVLGILIAINVVTSRSTQALDLTRAQLYSLSPKSVLVTRQLDSDLTVTGFYRPDEETAKHQAQALLDLYQQQSPHVKVRMVDADQNGAQAQALGVTIAGSLVLQYKAKPPVVLTLASQTEADVTGAILRLRTNRQPTICWATGEGERDLKDSAQIYGYSAASDLIRTNNYQVLPDVLVAQQGVPANCDVLAMVGPIQPLAPVTIKAIQDYLDRGGKLLLAVDPVGSYAKNGVEVLASTNAVLKPYGMSFDGGLVLDTDPGHFAENQPDVAATTDLGESPITKGLARSTVYFPDPTGISTGSTADVPATRIATTSPQAFQIMQGRDQYFPRRPTDRSGPFVLMQTLEETRSSGKNTRIVLVGTAGIGENLVMSPNAAETANPDLFLASLDWLSEQESLIAVGPKPPEAQPLPLTEAQAVFNAMVTLVVLPGLVLAAGLVVLVRRRRPVT